MRLPQLTDKTTISDSSSLEGRNNSTSWIGSLITRTFYRLVGQSYYRKRKIALQAQTASAKDAVEFTGTEKLIFELRIKDLETESSQFHVRGFALFRTNLFLTRQGR